MRVLLVEDDDLLLRSLVRLLRGHVIVESATDAETAWIRLGAEPFHAVVSDHDLGSGASGHWLLQQVRTKLPSVRRVLMTGSAEHADIADPPWEVFLLKPATRKEILEALGIKSR